MQARGLVFSALIGAVASSRSMTPMASIAAARLPGQRTPGRLVLLDRPLFTAGALVMGAGELFGDKMKTAPDRTVFLGLLARVMSAGIAGAALAPRGREQAGGNRSGVRRSSRLPDIGGPQAGHGAHGPDAQRFDRRRAGCCPGRDDCGACSTDEKQFVISSNLGL